MPGTCQGPAEKKPTFPCELFFQKYWGPVKGPLLFILLEGYLKNIFFHSLLGPVKGPKTKHFVDNSIFLIKNNTNI